MVQERHPREQGLKHDKSYKLHHNTHIVQERHPREQGLKPIGALARVWGDYVQERHPREQGLKLNNSVSVEI